MCRPGLALSIAKQIVELHGGTIEARSDGENRGATLVVRVPMAGRGRARARTGSRTLSRSWD
jgi:signal transduction histidine kinase